MYSHEEFKIDLIEKPDENLFKKIYIDTSLFNNPFLNAHTPDAHYSVSVKTAKNTVGRCSLWWTKTADYMQYRAGIIGHLVFRDMRVANLLLQHACDKLSENRCELAVGPMDGTTWENYRLITERGVEPPFFLEPDNSPELPEYFALNGFRPIANYISTATTDLDFVDPRYEIIRKRLHSSGVTIRTINYADYIDELVNIYRITSISFKNNLMYAPISEQDFIRLYSPLKSHVKPDLVFIAERDSEPVGFLFAIDDLNQAQRGKNIDTIIIKSLGILPHRDFSGLGRVLVSYCHMRARKLGYKKVIHALMRDPGYSSNLSQIYAKIIRRYALYAKILNH